MNNIFDGIYCINLTSRPDRWERFTALWERFELDIERFEGVEGAKLNFPSHDIHHNANSIGCTMSHIKVLELALSRNQKEVLILEDDACPCSDLLDRFKQGYVELPKNYNICYLGGNNIKPPKYASVNLGITVHTQTTVAYAITAKFAEIILKKLRETVEHAVVDETYFALQRVYTMYIFNPRLVHQYASYSDILHRYVDYNTMRDLL